MSRGMDSFNKIIGIIGQNDIFALRGAYEDFWNIRRELGTVQIIKEKRVDLTRLRYLIENSYGGDALALYNQNAPKDKRLDMREFEIIKKAIKYE